jgi:hypothetical protein
MATEEGAILDLTFPAGESLASDQYRIMILDTDGTVRRPDNSTTDRPKAIGVLQNAPASGYPAVVRVKGISKIVLGEAVVVGEYIKSEYVGAADAGKGLDADVALDVVIGRCVLGGAEDDLGEVLLPGMTYQVGIAS